jgi:hypothetical protein
MTGVQTFQEQQSGNVRSYFNYLGPRQCRLFAGADRCAIDAIMCHAFVIYRRQTMTHFGGPVEDVAR